MTTQAPCLGAGKDSQLHPPPHGAYVYVHVHVCEHEILYMAVHLKLDGENSLGV